MAAKGQLRVRIVGDDSDLKKKLRGASKSIGGFAKQALKVGAAGVAALGAAAIGGAFKVAKAGDEIAKSAGKAGVAVEPFQELRFAFGQGGVEAATMDTALMKFNKRLGESATGGGTADEAFASLGVSLRDANGNVRDATSTLDEVLPKLAAIESDAERAAVAGDLFGQRAGPELAAALSGGIDGIEDARQKAQDLGIVMSGEAAQAAEKFTDQWDDLKQSAGGLLRGALLPVMGFLSSTVIPVIQEKVIPALREFGQWLGPRLQAFGEGVSDFFTGTLVPAFQQIAAWWEANGPAIMAAVEDLWDTISTVFDAVVDTLSDVMGWFQDSRDSITGSTGETATRLASIWSSIQGIISGAVDFIKGVIRVAVTTVTFLWRTFGEDIVRFGREAWDNVMQVIDGALQVIRGVFDVFAGLFSGDWGRMWDGVKAIFSGVWQAIQALLSQALNIIRTVLSAAVDFVVAIWRAGWAQVQDNIRAVWDGIRGIVETGVQTVRGFFERLPGQLLGAISSAASGLFSWWRELPGRILSAVGDLGSLLVNAGRRVIQGFIDGITAGFDRVRRKLRDLTNMLPDWKGPKRVDLQIMAEPAANIMKGFADDLQRQAELEVKPTLAQLTGDLGGVNARGMAAGGGGVTVNVAGSVVTEREIAEIVRRELILVARRNGSTGIT